MGMTRENAAKTLAKLGCSAVYDREEETTNFFFPEEQDGVVVEDDVAETSPVYKWVKLALNKEGQFNIPNELVIDTIDELSELCALVERINLNRQASANKNLAELCERATLQLQRAPRNSESLAVLKEASKLLD